VDPVAARIGRDIRPQRSRLWGSGRESFPYICRHLWFRFLCRGRDLEADNVACLGARSFAQLPVHFEPMAFLAVCLEHSLKAAAIDRAFYRRHAAGGKVGTGALWQDEEGPGIALLGFRRPEEFRFKTDQGFGHLAGVIDRIALFGRCAVRSKSRFE
jgi:hypothetical protein